MRRRPPISINQHQHKHLQTTTTTTPIISTNTSQSPHPRWVSYSPSPCWPSPALARSSASLPAAVERQHAPWCVLLVANAVTGKRQTAIRMAHYCQPRLTRMPKKCRHSNRLRSNPPRQLDTIMDNAHPMGHRETPASHPRLRQD